MKELIDIVREARRLRDEGRRFALATVVRIGGSTYRRPGARMLVDDRGTRRGTISGGCLEGEVAEQARAAIEEGAPRLLPFDLSDDDLILGFGSGCDGVVHVLIEPVTARAGVDPIELLAASLDRRLTGVMATVIGAPGSAEGVLAARLVVLEDGTEAGGLPVPGAAAARIRADARRDLASERQRAGRYAWETRPYDTGEGPIEVLFERLRPPVRLVVFGEGHDVPPVLRFAKEMGWEVEVAGRKPAEELAARFPQADAHRFLMHPAEVLAHVPVDGHTAAVVMNHHYARDRALLAELLRSEAPYVGLLGPRERTARMVADLQAEGRLPDAVDLARLHGPVGLDLGTETPEEIALSIVAEVQAVLHGRTGGRLREREEPIHGARAAIPRVA